MTERKFTDEEIVKALECCSKDNVKDRDVCPYVDIETKTYCVNELIKDTLDLITRQKAEIEELEAENRGFSICLDSAVKTALKIKCETIKEFAERLRDRHRLVEISRGCLIPAVTFRDIGKVEKEMTEDKK